MHKKILNQKALRLTSFFDDETDTSGHFWDPSLLSKVHKDWTPSVGQFFFKKSKKKAGENKRIYMCLFKNYLITSKSKEWSRKYKSLDLSKNFVTLRKLVDPNGAFRFGFSLTYNTKQIEIYAKDSEEMNTFIYQLKKYVVQADFDEKLSIKEKLGNGSYAEVYRLEDKLTKTKYAGKIFNLSALALKNVQTSKRAIKNEAIIQRQMEHENITKLYEIYEAENKIILVMEYCQGKRLLDYVVEHAPISEKKSIMLIKQLIEGVIYIHDRGFIHRDIKLENAMITEESVNNESKLTIKILDFGLAVEDGQTEFLKKSGTPGYVAPEVFQTEKYDNKIDVFSLGVILFTMLAGRSPFVGPDRRTVLNLNKRCEFSFRTRHWHNKSNNCKDLVRRMMEPDPIRRPDARKTLDHPWFKLVYLNGVQPLINIPKIMTVSNAYIFAAGRVPSQVISSHQYIIFPITKKKSASETTFADTKAGTGRRKSTIDSNNSSVNQQRGRKFTFTSQNLLQIPIKVQTPINMNSNIREASREELEVSSIEDGLNRGSLRSFYKNNSSSNYESRSGSELSPTGRRSPIVKSNTLDDEIAMENPDIKDKLSSYKGLDASLQPSSNMNWSRNLPSLVGIPETKEEKLSFEVTNESLQFVKAQLPRSHIEFKALSPYLKSRQKIK